MLVSAFHSECFARFVPVEMLICYHLCLPLDHVLNVFMAQILYRKLGFYILGNGGGLKL